MHAVGDSRRAVRVALGLAILTAIYFAPRTVYVWLSLAVLAVAYRLLQAGSCHRSRHERP